MCYFQCFCQLYCIEVRGFYCVDFFGLLQVVEGFQCFCYWGLWIWLVGEIEVDIIGIQVMQRVVNCLLDSGFVEFFMVGEVEIGVDFGENFDFIVYVGVCLQLVVDYGFRFVVLVVFCLVGINICCIDSVKIVVNESIKKSKIGFFIDGLVKDVVVKD